MDDKLIIFKNKIEASLFIFCKAVLGFSLLEPGLHSDISDIISDPDIKETVILAPRGMYKSSEITIGYVIWKLCQNPDRTFLIASFAQTKAKGFLGEISEHMMGCTVLRTLYPDIIPSQREINSGRWIDNSGGSKNLSWNESQITVKRSIITKTPSISICGEKTAMASTHFNEIIFDDPITDRNYATYTQRQATITRYRSYVPLLTQDPSTKRKMILVGTRYMEDDIWGVLYKNRLGGDSIPKGISGNKNITFYNRAAIEDGDSILKGIPLSQLLQDKEYTVGSFLFAANYMNKPESSKERIFDIERVHVYKKTPVEVFDNNIGGGLEIPRKMNYFILHDPATGKKEGRICDSVVMVVGIDCKDNIYVIEYKAGKYKPDQCIQQIINFEIKYNPVGIYIEHFGMQYIIKHFLVEEMKRRGLSTCHVHPVGTTAASKHFRIISLQPYINTGRLNIKAEHEKLSEQIETFPVSALIDCLDVLSYIIMPDIYKKPDDEYDIESNPYSIPKDFSSINLSELSDNENLFPYADTYDGVRENTFGGVSSMSPRFSNNICKVM